MSLRSGDWRDEIDEIDAALIDGYQSGLPVEERPFDAVGADLGIDADEVVSRIDSLLDGGIVRRFGPVLNPPVIGSSTLAAVQAPADRFDEIADVVNAHPQVNHNYARDHDWNMWFVVTAADRATRDAILDDVASRTGCEVLNLPMLTDYYIDLEFPVVNGDRFARESGEGPSPSERASGERSDPGAFQATDVEATRISEESAADLSALDRRVLLAVQEGFPLSTTPYADVAAAVDAPVEAVLRSLETLLDGGCIKRIGCVVNHVTTGFDSNCMVVWDVPDEELDDRGEAVGRLPYVTLCYHRPRRPEKDWSYNLFTMIHGREADAVDEKIDELADDYLPFDHDRLYSTATLKQTGARYDDLVGT